MRCFFYIFGWTIENKDYNLLEEEQEITMIKIGLISLGCAKNLVDSEIILGMFNDEEFQIVNSIEESDIIIINTCGFIEASKQESIENILDVLKYHKKVVVTGCLVERYKEELIKEIPEVDLFVSLKDYPRFNQLLKGLINKEVYEFNPFNRLLATPPFMAYLRISEGCSNCCTYCAIPLIRGPFRSRPLNDLTKEAKLLSEKGIKELVLISQDTSRYGSDLENTNIITLLKELLTFKQFVSFRLLYLYPDEISNELIEFIRDNPRIKPYFDIPFQHASNKILKAMHRRENKQTYIELINKIRKEIPNAVIRTTYIVGFPDESDDDFNELIEFNQLCQFDHMGAFAYSREDGTFAYKLDNQIDEKTKKVRLNKIMSLQKKISYSNNKKHVGEVMDGIITNIDKINNIYYLRSYWNAPDDIDGNITFKANKEHKIGDEIRVKITSAFVYDLYGEEVS